ncbi:MAG TPA: nucleoside-diphosphate kinase, partial [Acidimicrobiales bacterium]|nr:nucleoside-diphosphate kinase [Acidimicrobiales bacterium]
MADRTFVICKPDAVERGLTGEIIRRFENKGLKIVAAELRTIDAEVAG